TLSVTVLSGQGQDAWRLTTLRREVLMVKQFMVIAGPDEGRYFPLPESGSCTIGSNRLHSEIYLHHRDAARAHCELFVDGDQVEVTDLDSPAGTFVNGERIKQHELHLGDVVRIGTTEMRLEEEEEAGGFEVVEDDSAERFAELSGQTLGHFE